MRSISPHSRRARLRRSASAAIALALVATALALAGAAGCGRIGYDPVESLTGDGSPAGDGRADGGQTTSDAGPGADGTPDPTDGGIRPDSIAPACMPACPNNFVCCAGVCYDKAFPVPCRADSP